MKKIVPGKRVSLPLAINFMRIKLTPLPKLTARAHALVQNSDRASLRKQPFLLALRRLGRFARRNVCDSATEIPYIRITAPRSARKKSIT